MDNSRVLGCVDRIETPDEKREGVLLPSHLSTVLNLPAEVHNGPAPPMAEEVVRHLVLPPPLIYECAKEERCI